MAEEVLAASGAVHPNDLIGQVLRQLVGIAKIVRFPHRIACIRRVHVATGVVAVGIEIGVDLEHVGLGHALEKVLGVVEQQQVACAGQPLVDPLDVVHAADLLVSGRRHGPVLQNSGGVTLTVACRIAEAVQQVPLRPGRQRQACLGIAGDEGVAVIDNVDLALNGVEHDLVQILVVVHGVQVQPVPAHGPSGKIDVQAPRVIGDGLAFAHVVGLVRIPVLHQVIDESPFPDHVAVHVDLHDGVDLGAGIVVGRVAPQGDALLLGHVPIGDVEGGRCAQLGVEGADVVVMRHIVRAGFLVAPDGVAVPVDLVETAIRIACEQVAVVQ